MNVNLFIIGLGIKLCGHEWLVSCSDNFILEERALGIKLHKMFVDSESFYLCSVSHGTDGQMETLHIQAVQ